MDKQEAGNSRPGRPNRLIDEKSPYLLQHAHNPVDWYPWGEEAFGKAREEDKPLFLSIGYSTCHWCHVMERESFEDPDVAALMNEAFVCIKVDREERPDLDLIYMSVCQMLTGSGGWPLTIIMTPDRRPFYAATYIPRGDRFGRTGMRALIPRIQVVWRTRREEVLESAAKVTDALRAMETLPSSGDPGKKDLDRAFHELCGRFDSVFGGFGQAPKFPTPHNLLFLFRYWKRTGDPKALQMAEKTLQGMRRGGLYDHVGFGFHRYSTDGEWLVPHFEKMLYDQALLAMAYLEAFQATGGEIYGQTAREIFTYVLRDMTSPDGGFYSAEDADSEGVEGRFYLWEEDEIRRVLDREESDALIRVYGVERGGNFLDQASRERTGANILHLGRDIPETAARMGISPGELEARLASAKKKLFETRERRVRPHRDDKILTDWNGLMIAALSRGAQVLGEPGYGEAAREAADFLLGRLRGAGGRLLHRYREGDAGISAHLDDYAFLVWGLIELYEATFESRFLRTALDLNGDMLEHFWDNEKGGFFFTADDGEELISRTREVYDGALPSGNSVALLNLIRLARFTGNSDLEEKGAKTARAFSGQIRQISSAFTYFLLGVDFGMGPAREVVVSGHAGGKDTTEMLRSVWSQYIPNRVIIFRPSGEEGNEISSLAPFTRDLLPLEGKATAYVCVNQACGLPTTDIREMLKMLGEPEIYHVRDEK